MFTYGKINDADSIFFVVIMMIGNGGYLALAYSVNLEEAILSNTITYVIGSFAPMIVFVLMCNVCRFRLISIARLFMFFGQSIIFLSACTVGKMDIFYRTVEFHQNGSTAFLTKTYGPMHTVYLVSLYAYTFLGLLVGVVTLTRKNVVSRINVELVMVADLLVVCTYLIERITHIEFDVFPIVFTLATLLFLIPLTKMNNYSIYFNPEIYADVINDNATIVFNNKLKFMGCNDVAYQLFPELAEWELEKKIPGNGGRFNTFLRQPLLKYSSDSESHQPVEKTYEYKNAEYRYKILTLFSKNGKCNGYVIRITNVTDIIKESKERKA